MAVIIEQQIGRFEVAVHEPLIVQETDCRAHLKSDKVHLPSQEGGCLKSALRLARVEEWQASFTADTCSAERRPLPAVEYSLRSPPRQMSITSAK